MLIRVCFGNLWVNKVNVSFLACLLGVSFPLNLKNLVEQLKLLNLENKNKTYVQLYRFGINGLSQGAIIEEKVQNCGVVHPNMQLSSFLCAQEKVLYNSHFQSWALAIVLTSFRNEKCHFYIIHQVTVVSFSNKPVPKDAHFYSEIGLDLTFLYTPQTPNARSGLILGAQSQIF